MRLVIKCASRGSLFFMKMLYPRKVEEVLWHSTTFRLVKSILVKIPKLPTMRVIGSQDISTILPALGAASVAGMVAVSIRAIRLKGVRFLHWWKVEAHRTCSFNHCHSARVDIRSLVRNAGDAIEVPCSRCAG